MALSGSKNTNSYDGRYYTLSWTATQNISNNTSTISWTLTANGGNSSWYAERTCQVLINGSSVFSKTNSVDRYKGTVASGTKTINHSADGSGSFSVAVNVACYYSTVNLTISTNNYTLDTIPRATTPTLSSSSVNVGASVTISMPRASDAFTHNLTYDFGSTSGTIGTGLGTSKSWTIPTSLALQIPNTTSGICTITCKTYDGITLIGTKTAIFGITVPDTTTYRPTVNVSHSEAVALVKSTFGVYVKGLSKVKLTITATGNGGASISSYYTTGNGTSYNNNNFTSDVLISSGIITFVVTVTDTRGYSTTKNVDIDVSNYTKPIISAFSVVRCNSDGTENDNGAFGKVNFKAGVNNLSGNSATYKILYKDTDDSTYTDSGFSSSALSVDTTRIIPLSTTDSYDFLVSVNDPFYTSEDKASLSTIFNLLNFGADGRKIAIGKVAEFDGLEIKLPLKISGGIDYDPFHWIPVTDFTSPYITASNHATVKKQPRYRKIGNHVYVEGNVSILEGNIGSAMIVFNLPEGYRPQNTEFNFNSGLGDYVSRTIVQADGNISIEWIKQLGTTTCVSGAVAWVDLRIDFFTD